MAAQNTRQLARSTLIVMVAFGAAKVVSLAQQFIVAREFGVGSEWDAYVVANSIPELIFTLIAGGALAFAFIPIFAGFLAEGNQQKAWKTASHVINSLFLLTLIVSVVVFLIAPWLVSNVIATGFPADAQSQTVDMMRILLVGTLIFSISGILMGILQSYNNFLLPALAPIMYSVGLLIGVVVLSDSLGVYGVAIGAVIGAALHLSIQIPGLIRVRAQWSPELGLTDPTLWRILRLMLPALGGLAVFSVNWLIMNNLASNMGEGAVSALSWGWRIMQIPETLIGTAMGTVIFPTLAALSAVDNLKGKREAMAGAIRFILTATIPASIALLVLGRPLLTVLEGGAFDASATDFVYSTLQFFTLGLIVQSVLEIAARSFYADKNTVIPFITSSIGAAINIVGAYVLSASLGVGGLALANSLGIAVEVSINLILLRRRWHGIEERSLFLTAAKGVAASLVMAAIILGVGAVWSALGLGERGKAFLIAQIAVQGVLGGLGFLAAAWILRMKELEELLRLIRRRSTAPVEAAVS
ncbi:MAG: murein biosynthesis integral membrane protein MurJ [Chloroflexi bacterium]|nr:murein biosynthesis integral membrane protein MurJ [Chloroflexota bacterium]